MSDFEKTFDNATLDYEQSRPSYPDELYRDLFAYQPVGRNRCALEIGAGTGKASLPILDSGGCLTALEPGAKLAAFAQKRFEGYSQAVLHQLTLQDFECAPNAFDLIYAATAFHWIPEAYGYRRVYELLKRGGAFARFAYHAGPDQGRPEMAEAIQQVYNRFDTLAQKGRPFGREKAEALAKLAVSYGFVDTQVHLYHMKKDFTADDYMKLLRTYPSHMALAEQERAELFSGIHDAIERHGGTISVYYTVDMELARKP